jgi:hypothetical protein
MKQFKPTYLYVKTHNVTGLKYFGKTTSNRKRYRGSGYHWVRHIAKHGYDVTTEIVGYFTDQDECMKFALEFSEKHNIVESTEWANLMPENGLSGGDVMSGKSAKERQLTVEKRKKTMDQKSPEEMAEIKKKNSISTKKFIQENPEIRKQSAKKILDKRRSNGQPWHSEETIQKIKQNNKAGTLEVRQKLREANLGKKNPEHSQRMKLKTGLDNKNTRVFVIITPSGSVVSIIGCSKLREFCSSNLLAYEQFIKHINNGKIEKILAQKPRPEMRNCLGYELKELTKKP